MSELEGPNGMARRIEERLADIDHELGECRTRAERSPLNKARHQLEDLLRFCKSRAGYVGSPADVGLLDPEDVPE